jgi:hypothetical protein
MHIKNAKLLDILEYVWKDGYRVGRSVSQNDEETLLKLAYLAISEIKEKFNLNEDVIGFLR